MSSIRRSRPVRGLAVCVTAATLLVACGSDDDGPVLAPGEEEEADAAQETGSVSFEAGTQLVQFIDPANDPAVGTASPVVEGERFDGSDITIGGPTDEPTLYVFLAHWCPACNEEVPVLIGMDQEGRLPAEFSVVGISTAANEERDNYPPSEWFDDEGWPFDVMADDENLTAIQVFGGNSFPYLVLVDADGTVLARQAGASSADDLANWIDSALAT